jgi:serine O-acetyltransferase
MGLFRTIYQDYRRFRVSENKDSIRVIFFTQGFWAVFWYRLAHMVYCKLRVPVIRQATMAILYVVQKIMEIITGIYLPARCQVGAGLFIGHFGNIIVNIVASIGENCNISQGMTIGVTHSGKYPGVPVIGNRVYVGPNAVIIGGINIGDDVAVGAGAIVTKPLPPRAVAVGNPARIISYNGSFDYIRYDGMDNDPERCASKLLVGSSSDMLK